MFEESGVRCGEQRRVTLTAEERNEARILTAAAAAVMDGRRNTLTIPRGRRTGGRRGGREADASVVRAV